MSAPTLDKRLRPRKEPRQPRSVETRARILDAARGVFAEFGYAAGTTNRIADAAGLSVGSLYQYFPNKDSILVELVYAHIEEGTAVVIEALAGCLEPGADGRPRALAHTLRHVVTGMVRVHGHDRELHRVLFEEAPRPPELLARLRSVEAEAVGAVAHLIAEHPEARVDDPALAARIVVDTIESLVHRIATDASSGVPDDALVTEIVRLVDGYLARPTER